MAKVKEIIQSNIKTGIYEFYCPGCEHSHVYYTKDGVRWTFNGDINKPTFNPSLLNHIEHNDYPKYRCHLYVKEGKIQYLNDCTHKLAGQIINMVEINEE